MDSGDWLHMLRGSANSTSHGVGWSCCGACDGCDNDGVKRWVISMCFALFAGKHGVLSLYTMGL
jgi:hypothetical protein